VTYLRINGRKIVSEDALHEVLSDALGFGPDYDRNLAALGDRLSDDVPRPIMIVWDHAAASRAQLGDDSFRSIVAVFDRARRQDVDAGLVRRFEFALIED
jgi:ribonuclease inhibitor